MLAVNRCAHTGKPWQERYIVRGFTVAWEKSPFCAAEPKHHGATLRSRVEERQAARTALRAANERQETHEERARRALEKQPPQVYRYSMPYKMVSRQMSVKC